MIKSSTTSPVGTNSDSKFISLLFPKQKFLVSDLRNLPPEAKVVPVLVDNL